jgi:hypothetical protein
MSAKRRCYRARLRALKARYRIYWRPKPSSTRQERLTVDSAVAQVTPYSDWRPISSGIEKSQEGLLELVTKKEFAFAGAPAIVQFGLTLGLAFLVAHVLFILDALGAAGQGLGPGSNHHYFAAHRHQLARPAPYLRAAAPRKTRNPRLGAEGIRPQHQHDDAPLRTCAERGCSAGQGRGGKAPTQRHRRCKSCKESCKVGQISDWCGRLSL